MKAFVVVSCLLAVASAGHYAPVAHHGAQHILVIGAHGVPVEPPANVAARAAHAAAHASAGQGGHYAASPALTYAGAPAYGNAAVGHGIPHDTPEVAAAKAAHFAALAKAGGHAGNGIYSTAIATPYAYTPALGQGHGALPLDTPEVAAAKAAHLAAHAKVGGHSGNGIYGAAITTPYAYAPALGHGHSALPLDTPEVAAAKAAHLAAHAAAAHGGIDAAHGAYDDGSYHGEYSGTYSHGYDDGSYTHY